MLLHFVFWLKWWIEYMDSYSFDILKYIFSGGILWEKYVADRKSQISTGNIKTIHVEKSVESVHNWVYIPGTNDVYALRHVEKWGEFTTFSEFLYSLHGVCRKYSCLL